MTAAKKINYLLLFTVMIMIFISFVVIFVCIYPVDFDNMGGMHSWLSAATIKYVNQWLEEGALHNHFTCYESFPSVEFQSYDARTPYISYPTGSTFLVFAAAKILGKVHIGISFLKKYQLLLYLAEALFFSVFLYCWLTDFEVKERVKAAVVYVTVLSWILLPVNVWYLANVYFADQAVIFFVMLFLLCEYISHRRISDRQRKIANGWKILVIYCGSMTDYYFWILVFLAFICHLFRQILLKHDLGMIVKSALLYICPVVLAIGTFVWQISYTNDWLNILKHKFLSRTGDMDHVWKTIFDNFCSTMADNKMERGIAILGIEIFILILLVFYFHKMGKWKELFIKNEYSIVMIGLAAPFLQIIVLKQHSAIHEFSMIKMGWVLVMSVLILALLAFTWMRRSEIYFGKKKTDLFGCCYVPAFLVMFALTGGPFAVSDSLMLRDAKVSYDLEKILYESAKYNDVFFSFTYSIPINPPQQLAVSQKQVYLIADIKDIAVQFPDLPEEANKMLIVEKNAEKDVSVLESEATLLKDSSILYEDEGYMIAQFP